MIRYLLFILIVGFYSCCGINASDKSESCTKAKQRTSGKRLHITAIEQSCINNGLVDILDFDSSISVKMVYSTDSNFMGFDVYGDFDKAYFQKEVAMKIVKANKILKEKNANYSLIIFDAARPRSIQQLFWDSVKIPLSQRANFIANPAVGSLHNYGCAVDISIVDDKNVLLDMGTVYDSPEKLAYPIFETKFLAEGKLTKKQIENRILLRTIMKSAGFSGIESEWWHFNATSLAKAKMKYKIIP